MREVSVFHCSALSVGRRVTGVLRSPCTQPVTSAKTMAGALKAFSSFRWPCTASISSFAVRSRSFAEYQPEARPSPEDLIGAYRQLIDRAHAHGLTIYGATLTPFEGAAYFTPEGEVTRQAVNQWIRTARAFDAVIDFDQVTRDPANPTKFLPTYDSGDHLHPNDAGYEAMGASIDLALFK